MYFLGCALREAFLRNTCGSWRDVPAGKRKADSGGKKHCAQEWESTGG